MKILSLLLIFFLFFSATACAIEIDFTAPASTYDVGDTFVVTITLHSAGNIAGWKFNSIIFPKNKLELLSVEIDDYWKQSGMNDSGTIDNSAGQLINAQAGVFFTSIPNETILLNLTFQAEAEGSAIIDSYTSELFYVGNATNAPHDLSSLSISVEGTGNGGAPPPPPPPPSDPDSDGDGVPDSQDVCPGHDDNIDSDGDGEPDGCDATPHGDPEPPNNETDPPDPLDPEAVITYENKTYYVGNQVQFSAKYSKGDIVAYYWDFGDGTGVNKLIKPKHAYNLPGVYTVTLFINDSRDVTDSTFVQVKVIARPAEQPKPQDEDITTPIIILVIGLVIFVFLFIYFRRQGLI